MEKDLKHFNNPVAEKVSQIFKHHVGKDVTTGWGDTKSDLDEWMKLRGKAAHEAPKRGIPQPHIIGIKKLKTVINGLKKLVAATEAELAKS
jgi:hypothetical protein